MHDYTVCSILNIGTNISSTKQRRPSILKEVVDFGVLTANMFYVNLEVSEQMFSLFKIIKIISNFITLSMALNNLLTKNSMIFS